MNNGYVLDTPPERWEEGALCGNGTLGSIAWCKPLDETVIFTHEKLFLPQNDKKPPVNTALHLDDIRRLLADGQYKAAGSKVVELGKTEGYPGMLWTDSFMPACDLRICLVEDGPITGYRRSLDFSSGLACTAWEDARGQLIRSWFVSRADNIGVFRLQSATGSPLSGEVDLLRHPPDDRDRWLKGQDRELDRFSRVDHQTSVNDHGDQPVGSIQLHCGFHNRTYGYSAAVRLSAADGQLSVLDHRLVFTDAQEILLLFALDYSEDEAMPPEEDAHSRLLAFPCDYEQLLSRHTDIHKDMYQRMTFHLDPAAPLPIEKIFHAGRYHILSSSGQTPPNLQGIWTGQYSVPWSSDYTQNGNTQTAILGMLPGNMPECMLGYFDYQESLLPDYRVNAQRLYGCRGILMASRTSNHGLNNHFNDTWTHTFWTAGAAWAAHFYYDYWLFTQDDTFFISRALPFMMEAALFYEDFLFEDENGYWMFSPSYSPENHPDGGDSQACINATMDIAVARELFGNLIQGCATLGVESERLYGWRRMLAKMPPYRINRDGALQEWCHDGLPDRYDHRHASHLYPLYYGIAPVFRDRPDLLEAAATAYRLRMQFRQKELGIMAFGLIQMGMVAAHLGDADTVKLLLDALCNEYYYKNLTSSHDAGPTTFNVDIGGGLPALVMESLVQSEAVEDSDDRIDHYRIHLLPSLPSAWRQGHITGLRARGGMTLDLSWQDGKPDLVQIHNPQQIRYTVCLAGHESEIRTDRDRTLLPDIG